MFNDTTTSFAGYKRISMSHVCRLKKNKEIDIPWINMMDRNKTEHQHLNLTRNNRTQIGSTRTVNTNTNLNLRQVTAVVSPTLTLVVFLDQQPIATNSYRNSSIP